MTGSRAPSWRLFVGIVGTGAAAALAVATATVATTGIDRPVIAGVGLVLTVAVNRIYVLIDRRGVMLEGVDVAEAPIVALALLLPPAEALLVFGVGSLLLEATLNRAMVKKILNVGVRVLGATVLLVPVTVVRDATTSLAGRYAAAAAGAALYTAVNAAVVAVVVAEVQGDRVRDHAPDQLVSRLLVWSTAVAVGLGAAFEARRTPAMLVVLLAPLGLMARIASGARQSQRQVERLDHVVEANSQILSARTVAEQEAALVEAAQDLLLWREVAIRDAPPGDGERGARLSSRESEERWLVARPLPDSDPWSDEDERILTVLAARGSAAFERARLQAKLSEQALVDPLTQIANRRQFEDRLDELSSQPDPHFAVVVIDLDGFKEINDSLGHAAGDELLQVAAQRLVAAVRNGDLVARVGGDEFVLLLRGVRSLAVAHRITRTIAERFAEPVRISRWQLRGIAVSIGLALAPHDGVGREVIRVADASMYEAKRARTGGGRALLLAEIPEQPSYPRASLSADAT